MVESDRRKEARREGSGCDQYNLLAALIHRSGVLSLEVMNISNTGICLRQRDYDPGIRVGIKAVIQPFPGSKPIFVECKHVKKDNDNRTLLGFKIVAAFTNGEYAGSLDGFCLED